MAGETSTEGLASYLPRRLVEQLAGVAASPIDGHPDAFPSAAPLADLTGFTRLSSDLSRAGAAGAEKLTAILDRCLGDLMDLIFAAGGDVVNFAGDAVIAVWPANDEADLRACVYRAADCAQQAQVMLNGWEAHPGHRLSLRIGIGVGECTLVSLGDDDHGRGWVAAGPALQEMGRAERIAKPGTTVLCAAALLGDAATGHRRECGSLFLQTLARVQLGTARGANGVALKVEDEALLEDAIKAYLPAAVLSRLSSGHTEWLAEWLAELRQITTVFVNVPDVDPSRPGDDAMTRLLGGRIRFLLDLHGGTLNKILVDDKGMTLVLAFGLPPLSHEDDDVRAVRTALQIERHLRTTGVLYGIGVSTGRAFCGVYGNARRREYTMLGDSVNLAARLMQLAKNTVWCDSETARASLSRLSFEDLSLFRCGALFGGG
jgi:class 3 adenylate cyclase